MGTDSFYYIKDYRGNYYRTDKDDQLVAAASAEEATVFTFAQANGRICAGKKSGFYCMVLIENGEEAAEETVQYVSEKDAFEEQEETLDTVSPVKELAYDEMQEPIEKNISAYDLAELDWAEYLTHFTYVASGINSYRDELAKQHSDIEQKICDILHYIELCEINDDEATDLVELLRVCRENRRDIKNELQRIEYFQNNLGTSVNVAKAKQALKCIKGLDNRKYKPRKYEELFKNCVLKDGRLKKNDLQATEACNAEKNRQFSNQRTYCDEVGENTMTEERYYTPFDGKENDWLSFAKQQAEFYRNAGQYLTNLQIDIREIDQEIEVILEETENANCNVAQGYKVFKRLKELRLERKIKLQEINCLYALTDYIDCEAFADTCEGNLAEIETIMNEKQKSDGPAVKEEAENNIVENIQDMAG